MNRRQFVQTGTLLTASGLTGVSFAQDSSSQLKLKKALKYQMIQDDSLNILQKFELVKSLGFGGLEIHMRDKVNSHIDEVLAARDQTGITIHGVLNSSSPEIKEAIDRAKTYGASSVLVVAGKVTKDVAYDVNYKEWSARLKEHAPYAEEQGIQLLVENVWNNFLLSPLEMAQFIDEINSPNVGVYFDVGNVVRWGFPDQWIRILGSRIKKLDIKEYSRKLQNEEGLRKGFNVEIGDGDADYPAVLQALKEINYSGWATAEVKGGDKTRLQEIARRMNHSLRLV